MESEVTESGCPPTLCQAKPVACTTKTKGESHPKILEGCQQEGLGIADGWFTLVDTLCRDLQHLTDNGRGAQVKAYQVKAKFAQLRFYAGGGDSFQKGMIYMASQLASRTCEECGAPGEPCERDYAWFILCPVHAQSRSSK